MYLISLIDNIILIFDRIKLLYKHLVSVDLHTQILYVYSNKFSENDYLYVLYNNMLYFKKYYYTRIITYCMVSISICLLITIYGK